jgi:hypothetical protein
MLGLTMLELSEDGRHCSNSARLWFYLCSVVGVILVAMVAAYLVHLTQRESTNEEGLKTALDRAEDARQELMPDTETEPSMQSTDVRNGDFCGKGVALYFNWLLFGMMFTLLLGGCCFVGYELSDFQRQVRRAGSRCDYLSEVRGAVDFRRRSTADPYGHESEVEKTRPPLFGRVEDLAEHLGVSKALRSMVAPLGSERTRSVQEKYDQLHRRMFVTSVATYVLVIAFFAGFSAYQLLVVSRRFDTYPSMRQFTALLTGVPKELTDGRKLTEWAAAQLQRHEDKLVDLWGKHNEQYDDRDDDHPPRARSARPPAPSPMSRPLDENPHEDLRVRVVGTSIAFDFYDHREAIEAEVASWLETLNKKTYRLDTIAQKELDEGRRSKGTQTRGQSSDTMDMLREHQEVSRDTVLADGAFMKILNIEEDMPVTLIGSGCAFLVFETRTARDVFVDLSKMQQLGPVKFPHPVDANRSKAFKIRASKCTTEPTNICWENFSGWQHFPHKIALGILIMLCAICVWMSLYLPYVAFYVDVISIPGMPPSTLQDMSLGLFIAIGNAVLAKVIDVVTSWVGFTYRANRDMTVLGLAFLGTLLNTSCDLCMVAIIAQGTVLQDAFSGKETAYDTAISRSLFSLIVPGYLFLPYLFIPNVDHFAPRWLARELVRTHRAIPMHKAIEAVQCKDWDIVWRYADMLNNTTICITLLFFTSGYGWRVMLCLGAFFCMIYALDKYLLLNSTMPTMYETNSLTRAFIRWWCVPTALLAAVVAFWGYKAQYGMFAQPGMGATFVAVHAIVYLLVVELLIGGSDNLKTRAADRMAYSEAAPYLRNHHRPWDFFNCNPVYCLRTRALNWEETEWKRVSEVTFGHFDKLPRECIPFSRVHAAAARKFLAKREAGGNHSTTSAGYAGPRA